MESTIDAIRSSGYKVGSNYLKGEKTPVAVLELFKGKRKEKRTTTSRDAYHNFWQSIVSGAKGVLLYSYFHKRDKPQFETVWNTYRVAAKQLSGKENLGKVILFGKELADLKYDIIRGDTTTEIFSPHKKHRAINYPSIDSIVKLWNRHIYVILVNSAKTPVTIKIKEFPVSNKKVSILFEDRELQVKNGELDISFAPLGVHILKASRP